jgi:hypothetical protein
LVWYFNKLEPKNDNELSLSLYYHFLSLPNKALLWVFTENRWSCIGRSQNSQSFKLPIISILNNDGCYGAQKLWKTVAMCMSITCHICEHLLNLEEFQMVSNTIWRTSSWIYFHGNASRCKHDWLQKTR